MHVFLNRLLNNCSWSCGLRVRTVDRIADWKAHVVMPAISVTVAATIHTIASVIRSRVLLFGSHPVPVAALASGAFFFAHPVP
jgi:hypothetical protein